MHLPGVPADQVEQLVAGMRRPEGTAYFRYGGDLFQREGEVLVVLELVAGDHYFLLERTADGRLAYFHSSPGTGTRVARVDLEHLRSAPVVEYCLVWSPQFTRLTLANADCPDEEFKAEGEPSRRQYRIGPKGHVFQIGDDNIELDAYSFFEGATPALQYTAIEAWRETVDGVRVLLVGVA